MRVPAERTVGGLRCGEVLAALSDFLDGSVNAATRSQIEEHLRGCDWCERFGNRFGHVVAALRRELHDTPIDVGVTDRLREALSKEIGR